MEFRNYIGFAILLVLILVQVVEIVLWFVANREIQRKQQQFIKAKRELAQSKERYFVEKLHLEILKRRKKEASEKVELN